MAVLLIVMIVCWSIFTMIKLSLMKHSVFNVSLKRGALGSI